MDLFGIFTNLLPVISEIFDPVTNVVGGAALVAAAFAKPKSQYGRKIHKVINILGANIGKAKNADD